MSTENDTRTGIETATLTPIKPATPDLSVSVGTLGNLKKILLDGSRAWTAGDVIKQAGLDPSGYEIRVSSNPANANTPIVDGNTIVLMTKVKGN